MLRNSLPTVWSRKLMSFSSKNAGHNWAEFGISMFLTFEVCTALGRWIAAIRSIFRGTWLDGIHISRFSLAQFGRDRDIAIFTGWFWVGFDGSGIYFCLGIALSSWLPWNPAGPLQREVNIVRVWALLRASLGMLVDWYTVIAVSLRSVVRMTQVKYLVYS